MGKIIDFTGTTFNDIPVEKVLDGAKHLDVVLVVGLKSGELYIASSSSDEQLMLWLTERVKKELMREY